MIFHDTMTSAPMNFEKDLDMLADFYEKMTLESCQQLHLIYAADAFFKDPFNEVRGLDVIRSIFEHMFVQVDKPRFKIHTRILQNNEAFLTWDFMFTMKNRSYEAQKIRGATHLRFNAVGRVSYHRDYWDAAEELYEKIPVLGSLMRLLKRIARK
ncbi:transcriptional regulator [Undibacterium terreum]|uniref:Transcriptional regulator n=2 Tax=Undibacterium terreum TaxID=1224302 RepID=A0A916XP61_9BURK|nr:transcriptional regulator [Undibacterium terreum]